MVQTRSTSKKRTMFQQRLPVTLISGFLGSGKTTLLKNVLMNKQGMKVAVIVNDMAELNIDGSLLQNAKLVQKEEKLVQMQNGCICCTLREDLLEEVASLARDGAYDYLMIESTGIGEPMQVAETFAMHVHVEPEAFLERGRAGKKRTALTFELEGKRGAASTDSALAERRKEPGHELCGPSLNDFARLDTCVTVVDVAQFLENMDSIEEVTDRYEGVQDEDERNISNLLIEQVEFANVILLNKCDLVTRDVVDKVEALVKILNPSATVLRTKHSKVELDMVLNTKLFNMEKAVTTPGWLQSINGQALPESQEYGITSFVYRARRPFHPERLFKDFLDKFFLLRVTLEEEVEVEVNEDGDMMEEKDGSEDEEDEEEEGKQEAEDDIEGVKQKKEQLDGYRQSAAEVTSARLSTIGNLQRSKGFFWVATKNDLSLGWSQAGSVLAITTEGPWFASIPKDEWPEDATIREKIMLDFDKDEAIGDRRQELVFIGQDLKRDKIVELLDACLMSEEEIEAGFEGLRDPLFGEDEQEDDDAGDASSKGSDGEVLYVQ